MAAGGHIIALVLPGMEGVKNISWATNIFPVPQCSVNASPTVHCAPWRHWHPGPVRVVTWTVQLALADITKLWLRQWGGDGAKACGLQMEEGRVSIQLGQASVNPRDLCLKCFKFKSSSLCTPHNGCEHKRHCLFCPPTIFPGCEIFANLRLN